MAYNPGQSMNDMMRRAGNRSRKLPNIGQQPVDSTGSGVAMPVNPGPPSFPGYTGPSSSTGGLTQTPAVQAANQVLGNQMPGMPESKPAAPAPQSPYSAPSPLMQAPPGVQADVNHYNYEPQPDGAWKVYPPGVQAPATGVQASLPRAASTADYRRMRQAFQAPQMSSAGQAPLTVPPAPQTY